MDSCSQPAKRRQALCTPTHKSFHKFLTYVLHVSVQERAELQVVGLDVSCRYQAHLHNQFPRIAADLSCYIGWMHSHSGHGLSCQLQYSAMYATGQGRTALENMEQLFVSSPADFEDPVA